MPYIGCNAMSISSCILSVLGVVSRNTLAFDDRTGVVRLSVHFRLVYAPGPAEGAILYVGYKGDIREEE